MKRAQRIATAAVLAVFTMVAAHVVAQQPDTRDRSILTFSNAVELPELTLQAGTYVFKLADTASRDVVQVWNEDETEVLGQWLYVQAERTQVSGDTVVMFMETPEGTTPAIQYWYYPGERIGKEFIYPRDQAQRIAARTGQPVLTEDGEIDAQGTVAARDEQRADPDARADDQARTEAQAEADAQARVDAERREADAQARAEAERRDPGARDQAVGTTGAVQPERDAPAQAQAQQARPDVLPQTASPLPLSGLIGLLSLGGAIGIRTLRRRENET